MGELRIIAGQWRGRKIKFPNESGLRPTLDRVRETIFNWLGPYLAGASCLDCFAGSGVLGLEALSRGAAHAVFIDESKKTMSAIQQNATALDTTTAQMICASLPAGLTQLSPHVFDIVFLDPPYNSKILEICVEMLIKNNLIGSKSILYIEAGAKESIDLPPNWQWLKHKHTATLQFGLLHSYK
jgi:16S rRNA (guanine966-N2)-methyltransferase